MRAPAKMRAIESQIGGTVSLSVNSNTWSQDFGFQVSPYVCPYHLFMVSRFYVLLFRILFYSIYLLLFISLSLSCMYHYHFVCGCAGLWCVGGWVTPQAARCRPAPKGHVTRSAHPQNHRGNVQHLNNHQRTYKRRQLKRITRERTD